MGLVRDLGLVVIIIQGGDTEAAKLLGAGLHYGRRHGQKLGHNARALH
jgi:hypothetical protein